MVFPFLDWLLLFWLSLLSCLLRVLGRGLLIFVHRLLLLCGLNMLLLHNNVLFFHCFSSMSLLLDTVFNFSCNRLLNFWLLYYLRHRIFDSNRLADLYMLRDNSVLLLCFSYYYYCSLGSLLAVNSIVLLQLFFNLGFNLSIDLFGNLGVLLGCGVADSFVSMSGLFLLMVVLIRFDHFFVMLLHLLDNFLDNFLLVFLSLLTLDNLLIYFSR